MLLAVDIGNTSTVLGAFEGAELRAHWRLATDGMRMADEYAVLLRNLLALDGAGATPSDAIVSSVVPPAGRELSAALRRYWGVEAQHVDSGTVAPLLDVDTDRPSEVGADRIVNAVAALEYPGDALIVVDFGTATNFDLVVRPARLLGVALAPGPMVAAEALFARGAQLPRVELVAPARAVGRNTVDALRSGLVFGYAEMVDGMIARITREARDWVGPEARITTLATGGFAEVLEGHCRNLQHVDPTLTLRGLRLIAEGRG